MILDSYQKKEIAFIERVLGIKYQGYCSPDDFIEELKIPARIRDAKQRGIYGKFKKRRRGYFKGGAQRNSKNM